MFGWGPKAPVSAEAQAWVEEALGRLKGLFQDQALGDRPVVLPTEEFFPHDFQPTEESLRDTLARVCRYMQIDPGSIFLDVFDDLEEEVTTSLRQSLPYWNGHSSGAAGTYHEDREAQQSKVSVKRSRLAEPMSLIAILAHELAHVRLLGGGHLDRDAPDMESLTDLATVFWGMGLFTSNAAAQFRQYDDGTKHGWSMRRLGYLSEPMFGYALAVFAWERGERKPAWAKFLCLNVGTYFRQSLRYLAHRAARGGGKISASHG